GSENKTRVRIDPESQEVIVEVINGKTGEEVRQIPGEQRLRLSKSISEYNSVAFNHNQQDDRPQ
ncbi:MAG: flagellar protein FlaG, partial [Nitrospinae bacterium]|nr:flagellar protein FlaG [Nitrospinota bacterium]